MSRQSNKWLAWVGWVADATFGTIGLIIEKASDECAEIAIRALPLVAPVPNAIGLFFIAQTALGFGYWQSIALAITVEMALLGVVDRTLKTFDGYLANRATYKVPMLAMVVCVNLLLGIVFSLVYWLEVRHAGGNPILAVLPFISGIGAVVLGVRRWDIAQAANRQAATLAEQEQRRFEWQLAEDAKAAEHERKMELRAAKVAHPPAQPEAQPKHKAGVNVPSGVQPSVQQQAQQLHSEGFTNAEISRLLDVHRNSVSNWLKHVNGKVEVSNA